MTLAKILRTGLVLVALLAVPAAGALAGDEPTCEKKKNSASISIEVEGDDVILTRSCDGSEKVVMVNMDAIGEMFEGILAEASAALEELDDMQVKIHLGDDNMLSFADAETEWEVDLDQIARQVSDALQAGFEEFETAEWSQSRGLYFEDEDHEGHDAGIEVKKLQKELDQLQEELKKLRKELKRDLDETARDRN